MADSTSTIQIKIDAAEAAKTTKELKKSLKELIDQQANVAAGSAEWKKLTKAINETEGKIGDLQDSFKTLQGSGIERVKSSFNLLKEGFTSFDGGKIKAAFSGIGAAMKAIPIFLVIEGIRYLIENFDKLKNSGGLLGKVFQGIGSIIDSIGEKITWLADKLGIIDAAAEEASQSIIDNGNAAKDVIADQTAEYDRQIAVAKASGKNAVDLEIAKQQAIIETNKALVQQTIAYVRNGGVLNEEQNKLLKEQLNSIKSATAQIDVIRLQEIEKEKEKNKKLVEANNEKNKQIADANKALLDKIQDLQVAAIQDEETRELDALRLKDDREREAIEKSKANQTLKNQALKLLDEQYARDVNAINEKFRLKRLEDEKKALAEQERLREEAKQAELKRQAEITANNKKVNDDSNRDLLAGLELRKLENGNDLQSQLDYLETKKQIELENKELTENEKLLIAKKYADEEQKLRLGEVQKGLQIAQQGLQATQAVTDAYFSWKLQRAKGDEKATLELQKKQFAINKALQITNAAIGTAQGIVQALASLPPPASYIFAAINGVMGAAQIAAIASKKFEGTASSSGGGGAMSVPTPSIPAPPTISTPNNNVSGTQFDSQGNVIQQQQAMPAITVTAQVVETEMTDSQTTVQKFKKQSTF
jgi:hypothetical protein